MKTFVVLRRSVYRAAVAVLPAPVMLTVLVGTIFFKPKPIGWFRSSDSFPLTVPIVYLLFMNRIITGDERNVKNLETQVYVSWGMSFKDGLISLQKQIRSIHCYPPVTEVTQSTYNQNGEFEAGHTRHSPYIVVTLISNIQKGEFEAHIAAPPVTQLTQSANRQNGEFEAAHCRMEKPLVP